MRFPVRYYQEDGWWMAEVPDFDAVTQGRTREEIEEMALDLVAIHVDGCWERGEEVRPGKTLPGEGWAWLELPLRVETALRIRRARRRRKMTMQEAADAMGVTLSAYARWEDPYRNNATLDTLERIAHALGSRPVVGFR